MIININVKFNEKVVCTLAKDEATYKNLVDKALNIVYLTDKTIEFLKQGTVVKLESETIDLLSQFQNYDVFQIDEVGNLVLYYSNERVDNTLLICEKCNSNCIMCPVSDSARKKDGNSTKHLLEIINHLPTYINHLTITGGEPFLIGDDIFIILESLKSKFKYNEFLLLTNGRAIAYKPYFEKFLNTVPNNTIIGIPIHGHVSSVHDKITRVEGSFQQTCAGIKNLLSYDFKVEIRIVVNKQNIEYINDIAKLIVSEFKNVFSVKLIGLEMLGNAAKNQDEVWITYKEAFSHSKNAILYLIRGEIDVALYNFPLCSIEEKFFSIAHKSISDYKINYFEECDICKMKNTCGGVFSGTKRLAKYDIKAWV